MSSRFSRTDAASADPLPERNGFDSGPAALEDGPAVSVTVYRDGPLLVRGPVRFLDQEGNEIAVNRKVVALCRCGKSRLKPLCDGTHKLAGFKAPSGLTRLEERRPKAADAGPP